MVLGFQYTDFQYSRKQINRELSYHVPVGRLALTHIVSAKGSAIAPKTKWGVCIEMYREQPRWWSPFNDAKWRTKSFTAFKTRAGLNFMHVLGLPVKSGSCKGAELPAAEFGNIDIVLPDMDQTRVCKALELEAPAITRLKIASDDELSSNTLSKIDCDEKCEPAGMSLIAPTSKLSIDMLEGEPIDGGQPDKRTPIDRDGGEGSGVVVERVRTKHGSTRGVGGSVRVLDPKGNPLDLDPDSGDLLPTVNYPDSADGDSDPARGDAPTGDGHPSQLQLIDGGLIGTDCAPTLNGKTPKLRLKGVQIEAWELHHAKHWDQHDFEKAKHRAIVSSVSDSFTQICKKHKLKFDLHSSYRKWLIGKAKMPEGRFMDESDLPLDRTKLRPGVTFHYPSGSKWSVLTSRAKASNVDMQREYERIAQDAMLEVVREVNEQKNSTLNTGKIYFARSAERAFKIKAKKRRSKAIAGGTEQALPPSTKQCLEGKDVDKWIDSMGNEMGGLIEMGVIDLSPNQRGYTREEIHAQGITSSPCPIGLYHEHKYNDTGQIDKYKTRAALQGHSGNMQKGIHFWATFSATPREDTCRILMAITARDNLFQKSGDIEKAYCWSPLPKNEWIACRMPKPFREFDEQGNELYGIVKKNLYGAPPAGRNWGKHRDCNVLCALNNGASYKLQKCIDRDQVKISDRTMKIVESGKCKGWRCWQTEMDPCLFVIISPTNHRSLVMIHTDDVDASGEKQEDLDFIFDILNSIWKVKIVDSSYILGVKRIVSRGADGRIMSIEMCMPAYCEGAAKVFEEHLPKGTVNDFFPEKLTLQKGDATPEEIKRYLPLYQRATGILMWAVRHVFVEGRFGMSQYTSVMSCPSEKAFKAIMSSIAYIGQRSKRGIRFSHGGNCIPFAMFDASNKPKPDSAIAQGGYVIFMMNGPICTASKSNGHIGHSSEHNEYMAMARCSKAVIWLRQLLEEIGDEEYVSYPTFLFGDNVQANNLCQEHFTSTGNQYIYIPYHFNREVYDLGLIKVFWVRSGFNVADLMTKALSYQKAKGLLAYLLGYKSANELQDFLLTILDEAAMKAIKSKN